MSSRDSNPTVRDGKVQIWKDFGIAASVMTKGTAPSETTVVSERYHRHGTDWERCTVR